MTKVIKTRLISKLLNGFCMTNTIRTKTTTLAHLGLICEWTDRMAHVESGPGIVS